MKHRASIGVLLTLLSILVIVLALPITGLCEVPQQINFQGRLTDAEGNPLNGDYTINFHLFNAETGGSQLWSSPDGEEQMVTVINGIYNVKLGIYEPLDSTIFYDGMVWLEVVVEGEILFPRQQITATAYALKAGDADTLGNHTVEDFSLNGHTHIVTSDMIADGTVTAADLGNDSVSSSEITSNAVSSIEVLDNSLTAEDLADNSVGSGEIASNAVGQSELAPNSVGSTEIIDGAVAAADLNDGPGSGVNADLLDNLNSTAFMPASTDLWVNTTGDTMSGDLNIISDINAINSSAVENDYTANFESTGGTSAYAINIIASSTSDHARGLSLDVDSSNSNAYGGFIDVNSYHSATGIAINSQSLNDNSYALNLYSKAGAPSTGTSRGIYSTSYHEGAGTLYGISNISSHLGPSGNTYGFTSSVFGSATGGAYGVYGKANKNVSDTSGVAYGGYFVGKNDREDSSYGVYGDAIGEGGDRYGVYGRAIGTGDGEKNYGVYGYAQSNGDEYNFGGYFNAYGPHGTGVFGEGDGETAIGIKGITRGNLGVGVHGMASALGSDINYGGYFSSLSTGGVGVYGTAFHESARGVYGKCDLGYAIYGESKSGFAGFFKGKAKIIMDSQQVEYGLKLENDNPFYYSGIGILFAPGGDGPDRGKGALVYEYSNSYNRGKFHFLQRSDDNDSIVDMTNSVMTIANGGNVGIGTTNPTYKLDVNGTGRFRVIGSGSYHMPLNVTSDGTLTTATSDRHLKTNIKPIKDGLEMILNLEGVRFNWKEDSQNEQRIGLIAQDVEKVIPELTFINPTDGNMGIYYAELTAVLIEAVKTQQESINRLKEQIEELKNKEKMMTKSTAQL